MGSRGFPRGRGRRWIVPAAISFAVLVAIPLGSSILGARTPPGATAGSGTFVRPVYDPLVGDPSGGVPRFHVMNTPLGARNDCCPQLPDYLGWLTYDSADGAFWVADSAGTVGVVPTIYPYSSSYSLPVGRQPFGVAADPGRDEVFVTDSGSDNVTVISDTSNRSIASIGVGTEPMGLAFDPRDSEMFVANAGSDSVSVLSTSTLEVAATIDVGLAPEGVVYDAATDRVFVTDTRSDVVQAISPASDSVIGTYPVGAGPFGIAVDNATDDLYVTNSVSENVTVLDAFSGADIADIAITGLQWSLSLAGIAFDSATGQVWVGGGSNYLIVLNTTTEAIAYIYSWDPTGVAYDPVDGLVCVTNTANATFECLARAEPQGVPLVELQESGLPPGTPWSVDAGPGSYGSSTSTSLVIGLCAWAPWCTGWLNYTVDPVSGYVPLVASGHLDVGANRSSYVNVSVVFVGASTYPVLFEETGLASETGWSIELNRTIRLGSGTQLRFDAPAGSYSWSALPVDDYGASPGSGALTVHAAAFGQGYPTTVVNFTLLQGRLQGTISPSSAVLSIGGIQVAQYLPGSYRTNATAGTHQLEATAPGYETLVATVTVYANVTSWANVTLTASPFYSVLGLSGGATDLLFLVAGASIVAVVAAVVWIRSRERGLGPPPKPGYSADGDRPPLPTRER